jgi:hypothetical protein
MTNNRQAIINLSGDGYGVVRMAGEHAVTVPGKGTMSLEEYAPFEHALLSKAGVYDVEEYPF